MKTLDHNKAVPNELVINTVLEQQLYFDDAITTDQPMRFASVVRLYDFEQTCIREVDEFMARMINQ